MKTKCRPSFASHYFFFLSPGVGYFKANWWQKVIALNIGCITWFYFYLTKVRSHNNWPGIKSSLVSKVICIISHWIILFFGTWVNVLNTASTFKNRNCITKNLLKHNCIFTFCFWLGPYWCFTVQMYFSFNKIVLIFELSWCHTGNS